jgi:hypothetical protein
MIDFFTFIYHGKYVKIYVNTCLYLFLMIHIMYVSYFKFQMVSNTFVPRLKESILILMLLV